MSVPESFALKPYQSEFTDLVVRYSVLKFGDFVLKSGRKSSYFFNLGALCSGAALSVLGGCYASAIVERGFDFDVLFGAAYKGIPIVAATAIALQQQGLDVSYAYNRKEAKQHGEGGQIVGPALAGKRVLIVDDLITAGTAIREVLELLQKTGAIVVGVVVALDRQENGAGEMPAIEELARCYGIPVVAMVTLQQLMTSLGKGSE